MTPDEHNKYVGFAQLGYAGFHLITIAAMAGLQAYIFKNVYRSQEMGGSGLPAVFWLILVIAGVLSVAMTIPPIVAGYALLKRRPWAKVAGIAGGVVAAGSFPIGTAVAVYTFWFLFGDAGKEVYEVKKMEQPPSPRGGSQRGNSCSVDEGWATYTPPPAKS